MEQELTKGWFALCKSQGKEILFAAKKRRDLLRMLADFESPIEIVEVIKGERFGVEVRQKFFLSRMLPQQKANVN